MERLVSELSIVNPQIVVISSGLKGEHRKSHAADLMQYLERYSPFVEQLDLHLQTAEKILDCDICVLGGGSPYVLLNLLRSRGKSLLNRFLRDGKLLVGISGGAMVLGKDVSITPIINPTIPRPKDFNFEGLGLFEENVFPHFDRYEQGLYKDRQEEIDSWLRNNLSFGIRDAESVVINYESQAFKSKKTPQNDGV